MIGGGNGLAWKFEFLSGENRHFVSFYIRMELTKPL